MFLDDDNKKPRKSNMIFSCGPNEKDRQTVPSKYYRKDKEYDGYYYKLTAPLFVTLEGELTKVTGPVRFEAMGDKFWGGSNARDFRSKIIENPTYRSLMGAAQASQKRTKDYHHSFIEGCYFKRYEMDGPVKVMILQLTFGS